MLSNFGIILLAIVLSALVLLVVFGISWLLRPNKPNEEKQTTYESGEEPLGNANVQFNVRYYVVAIIFLLFDVELVFLFPWATVFGNKQLIQETSGIWGWFTFVEMVIFIAILSLGLAYAWARGYLNWIKPATKLPLLKSKIPMEMYEKVNEKYSK